MFLLLKDHCIKSESEQTDDQIKSLKRSLPPYNVPVRWRYLRYTRFFQDDNIIHASLQECDTTWQLKHSKSTFMSQNALWAESIQNLPICQKRQHLLNSICFSKSSNDSKMTIFERLLITFLLIQRGSLLHVIPKRAIFSIKYPIMLNPL